MSPSEYIYQTQLENIKVETGGWQPKNIIFFTYAKLMLMTDEELSEILPDYIILDEFHRCGAQMWGAGVKCLLNLYPNAPIIGLSATAIRYLDNQRDMADELFEGNVASEMTLGEAIVRGILNPPKYVLSVFAYQEYYDEYGNVDVPYDFITPDGVNVWYWLNKQKKRYLSGKLEQDRIVLLNDLNIRWMNMTDS